MRRPAVVGTLWLIGLAVTARTSAPEIPQPAGAGPAKFDNQAALMAFAGTFVRDGLTTHQVAGASVAVVGGDRIELIGRGTADPATGAPLDPVAARFHIASVTKLITAIAVMQQVEAGAIDLDADVERYLDGALARHVSGQGIRVRHLLTHTAGFADRWVGMAASGPGEVLRLDRYLVDRAAPIVHPPGTMPRYSNYGFSLAGHIVERVTKQPFATYVDARVLAPLGATSSYIGPRLPDARDVLGFFYRDRITAEPRIFEHTVPAGGAHSTVADLARVVGAIAGDGAFAGARVLSPESARTIRSPQFAPAASLPGWGFGLYARGGWPDEAWLAGGEVPGFSTRALILPERRLAVIVAVNRKDPTLALELFDAVMARLPTTSEGKPGPKPDPPAGPAPSGLAAALAGRYRVTLGDPSSFLQFASLFAPAMTVRPLDAGTIAVTFANTDRPAEIWKVTSAGTFLDALGHAAGATAPGASNRPTRLFLADPTAGLVTVERVPWWRTAELVLATWLTAVVTSVVSLIWLGVTALARRPRHRPVLPRLVISGLTLGFTAAFVYGLAQLAIVNDDRFAFGLPWWFVATLCLPVAIAACWLWLLFTSWRSRASIPGRAARRWNSWVLLVTLAWLATLAQWNLFGPGS